MFDAEDYYTTEQIETLKAEGKGKGATHLLIVSDRFSCEQYHVFVKHDETLEERLKDYNPAEFQEVDHIYPLV